jgi:hypothetical protein|eukprot:5435719-Prymnesium_polylepis.1
MNFVYAPPRGRGRPRKDAIASGVQRTIAKPVQAVQALQPRLYGYTPPHQELGRHPASFWNPLPQAGGLTSAELELRTAKAAQDRREREERAATEAKNRAEFEAQASDLLQRRLHVRRLLASQERRNKLELLLRRRRRRSRRLPCTMRTNSRHHLNTQDTIEATDIVRQQ